MHHQQLITQKVLNWYDSSSVNKKLTIRRFALSANHITDESSIKNKIDNTANGSV